MVNLSQSDHKSADNQPNQNEIDSFGKRSIEIKILINFFNCSLFFLMNY